MNIKAYRIQKGIQGLDIVNIVRINHRGYDKALQSKVERPEKYGIGLVPEAVRLVEAYYGEYDVTAEKPIRKPENRRLPCRLYVRLSEHDRERLRKAMDRTGDTSVQDYVSRLLRRHLDRLDAYKESRPEMAVSKAAREETIHQNHTPTSAALSMDWQGRR